MSAPKDGLVVKVLTPAHHSLTQLTYATAEKKQ